MLMEEFGPITVEQLRELFEEGVLNEADLVRSENGDVWTTMAAVKSSLSASGHSGRAMEEIVDLSELAFDFEDSGPTARRGAYAQGSTQDVSPVSMEPLPGSLVQSPGPMAADSGSPVSSPRGLGPQMPTSGQPAEEWFCESLGQVLGPMSFEKLISLGESGALDALDRVRCGERGLWKTVDCLPRVMRAVAVGRAVVRPQKPETVPTKSRDKNPRTKRRKNVKGEEELLDEIFDDVFHDDSPPSRSNSAAQSFATSSATAPAGASINTPGQTTPPTVSPQNPMTAENSASAANSASASQESSRAAGARLTAAAMAAAAAKRPSSKSAGSSFDVNPATIGILMAVMLVAAGGWYVWQNGIPGFSGSSTGNGTFDRDGAVEILQATMDRYKAVPDNPSESEWKEFSEKTKTELSALFKTVYDRAGSTPKGAACLAATMCLIKIARSKPDNKEFIDENLAEFERQVAFAMKQ